MTVQWTPTGTILCLAVCLVGTTVPLVAAAAQVREARTSRPQHPRRQLQDSPLPDDPVVLRQLIAQYNATLQELTLQQQALVRDQTDLAAQVNVLEFDVTDMQAINAKVEQETANLTRVTADLQLATQETQATVDELTVQAHALNETTQDLREHVDALVQTLQSSEAKTVVLEDTAQEVEQILQDTQSQTAVLQALEQNFAFLTIYLTNTNTDIAQETFASVQMALASSIALTRVNAFGSLYNWYLDTVNTWDCRNADFFGDQAFFTPEANQGRSIVSVSSLQGLTSVLAVVDDRLLQALCLDQEDFNRFLTNLFYPTLAFPVALQQVTYAQIEQAVLDYGNRALAYYGLPTCNTNSDCQVSPLDWEQAKFDCHNLPAPYRWMNDSP